MLPLFAVLFIVAIVIVQLSRVPAILVMLRGVPPKQRAEVLRAGASVFAKWREPRVLVKVRRPGDDTITPATSLRRLSSQFAATARVLAVCWL